VPKYGVFETRVQAPWDLPNPFTDAKATGRFRSPSGATITVEGFYCGGREWRFRFVPREHGLWRYQCEVARKVDQPAPGRVQDTGHIGEFRCEGAAGHGPVRISRRNPFRMEYEDGTPFYPIGIQTCSFLRPDFDGPNEDGSWRSISTEEWLKAFAGAVNLVRTQFGQGTTAGCALALIPAPPRPGRRATAVSRPSDAPIPADRYDLDLAAKIDETYRLHRAAGIAQILILFQDMSLWGSAPCAFGSGRDLSEKGYKNLKAANLPLQEQYIRYIVARWGAFVDIWELFNEDSYAPNDYLAHLAKVVRQADPYGHVITTNYARPKEDWCEIVTFHEYMGMPPNEVDAYLSSQLALYKSYGKVVQNTEFGNQGQLSNCDPVKWRIAVWTAFMNESGMLFWGMSGVKTKAGNKQARGNANAYVGADSRRHFRVLNEFTRDLPLDMRPVPVGYHEHTDIRTWALSNGAVTAIYVHHFADHQQEFQLPDKLKVQTGPGRFRLRWIDPEDGREVRQEELSAVQHYLEIAVPPVKIDLACRVDRITPDEPSTAPAGGR
jgi:hypothetical protein